MLSLILVTVEAKFLLFSLESLNKYFFCSLWSVFYFNFTRILCKISAQLSLTQYCSITGIQKWCMLEKLQLATDLTLKTVIAMAMQVKDVKT